MECGRRHGHRARRLVTLIVIGLIAFLIGHAQAPAQRLPADPTHDTTTADIPGLDAAASKCTIAEKSSYGFAGDDPIQVGGGDALGPSREVKYLNALRGPAGQGLHFRRRGSSRGVGTTIVDIYEITYAGVEKPFVLSLDEEHWTPDPKAPKGFVCGTPIGLTRPGPDPFETLMHRRSVAIDLGVRELAPIPLDPGGLPWRGVIFDDVRLIAGAARAASAAGHPLDPKSLPPELTAPRLVIVAYPLTCEERRVMPTSITLADGNGNSPPRIGEVQGDALTRLLVLAGYATPAPVFAVAYNVSQLVANARVTIQYDGPDCSVGREVVLPVKFEAARLVKPVQAAPPPGVDVPPGTRVVVQVLIGFDEKPLFPAYVSGPEELIDAAIAAAREWQIAPPRMNGAPVLATQSIAITFRQP